MKRAHIIAPDERVVDLPPVKEHRSDDAAQGARHVPDQRSVPAEPGGAPGITVHLDGPGLPGARRRGIVE